MADTPNVQVRIDPALIDAARARVGDPNASLSVLLRAGVAVLAGAAVADALRSARARPGPKPRQGTSA